MMKIIITLLLLLITNIRPIYQNPIDIKQKTSIDWELLTKAASFESGGEPFIGQLFVAQLIINRQKGCECPIKNVLSKKFHKNKEYLDLIEATTLDTVLITQLKILETVKIHNFWYFYNPNTATDKKFIKAMKKKKNKLILYNHIFVEK